MLPIKINFRRMLPGLLVIGLIPAVAISLMGKCGCGAKSQRVKGDFSSITSDLRVYRENNGELPSTLDGLEALSSKPSHLPADSRWQQLMDERPIDPWGSPYQYFKEDALPEGFGLYSLGPDLRSMSHGGDYDDISSWAVSSRLPPLKPDQKMPALILIASVFFVVGLTGIFLKGRPERLFEFAS